MIPGSALRKLAAMTGLATGRTDLNHYYLERPDGTRLVSRLCDEKDACDELRRKNWKFVCDEVFTAQKWECYYCLQVKPLQGHHVLFRSRWMRSDGPLDVTKNCAAVCQSCHQQIHNKSSKSKELL